MLLVVLCTTLSAATITRDEARQKAQQFLTQRHAGNAASRSLKQAPLKLAGNTVGNATTDADELYIFNVGQQEGFVIVSGDDNTAEPILGYADQGAIDSDNMPDNLRAWLQGYADQIRWMQQHPESRQAAESRSAKKAVTAVRSSISQLLTTRWNQGNPYNTYCPEVLYPDNSYQLAATGCVATATAQIMYYQAVNKNINQTTTTVIPSYFAKENGVFWYFGNSGSNKMSEKSKRTFDWSKIDPTLTTTDAKEEVARLMEYIGAAVEMQYGPESSASNEAVPTALSEYFGYDPDARTVYEDDYTYEEWVDLIYTELSTNGPVLLGGQSSGGGHAFVVDGYTDNDYFHINWGWGGLSDGNYRLSAMRPEHLGVGGGTGSIDGYNSNVTAMVNVKPTDDGVNQQDAACLTATICDTPVSSVGKYQVGADTYYSVLNGSNLVGIPVNYSFINNTGWDISFDWALALYQGNEQKQIVNLNENISFRSKQHYFGSSTHHIDGTELTDGEYRLLYVSRKHGTEPWRECEGSDQHYVKVVINGDNMTLTNMPASIKATYADGSQGTIELSSTIDTPQSALSLDISSVSGVTTVTPNSNPNTLYFVGETTPAGLENCNVVKNGVAEKLNLSDDYGFYSPTMFYANAATYTRKFDIGANGSGGWSTIVVPFNVTTIKQGSKELSWFKSDDDSGDFWLKYFSSEGAGVVGFDYATSLQANMPYIIAVPGNAWGEKFNLTGKDITFEGGGYISSSIIQPSRTGSHYGFVGTTVSDAVANSYVLDSEGSNFERTSTTVEPFRAYFVPLTASSSQYAQLAIGSGSATPTAITPNIALPTRPAGKYYNLNGQRVAQPRKGLYIVDGRKVIVK